MTTRSSEPPPAHGDGTHVDGPHGPLYVETRGSGPALVVVPGGPGANHTHYHPWFDRLADSWTVVYLDCTGTGRSARAPLTGDYTVALHADDVAHVVRALGLETYHLVGMSYGSLPAAAHALDHPERVLSLTISNGHHSARSWQDNIDLVNAHVRELYPHVWEQLQALRADGVRSGDPRAQALYGEAEGDLFWVDPLGHPPLFRGDDVDAFSDLVYQAVVGDDPEWTVTGTLAGYDPTARLRSLDVDTLVVTGRYDRVTTPRMAAELAAVLPRSELVVFEQSAHRPWVEEPEEYFRVLRGFLAR